MSNGIDSLANGNSTDISNMLGQTPDAVYNGTPFTESLTPSVDAQNIDGVPQMLDASNGFGQVLDSTNNLGVGGTLNTISSQTGN
jgi:uncharacterized membrane protein